MLRPEEMTRVDVVVLEGDLRPALTELGRLGCTHLIPARSQASGDLLQALETGARRAECESLLGRVIALQEKLKLKVRPGRQYERAFTADEIKQHLGPLEERTGKLCEERDRAAQTAADLLRQEHELDALSPLPAEAFAPDRLTFITLRVGWLKRDQADRLAREADYALVVPLERRDDRELIAAVVSRKKRFALQTLLEQMGFAQQEAPDTKGADPAVALRRHRESRLALLKKTDELNARLAETAGVAADDLGTWRNSLETEIALYGAMAQFGRTRFTCVAAGWVPTSDAPRLRDSLLAVTGGRAMVSMRRVAHGDPAQAAVPVKAKLHPFFRPFRILVSNFGLPTYGEIEPTPFVAISFLALFGLMFGDLGQGAVLAGIGALMRLKGRKEFVRDFGFILIMAGLSAMLFGTLLYGSIFGREGVVRIPGLTLEPFSEVNRLFSVAIVSGIVLLSAGVILNVINRFSNRGFYRGALDKFGIVGLFFYWGVLALVIFGGAPPWAIVLVVGLPLALILASEPLRHAFARGAHGAEGGLAASMMEGLVEVMETVIAYLANTASFLRVAGFALAHAGLCFAMWEMYESVNAPVVGWLIVIFGNIIVIALEGLVSSIQCMRLQYHEFFGKFFRGEGKAFEPFRLGPEK